MRVKLSSSEKGDSLWVVVPWLLTLTVATQRSELTVIASLSIGSSLTINRLHLVGRSSEPREGPPQLLSCSNTFPLLRRSEHTHPIQSHPYQGRREGYYEKGQFYLV